MTDRATPHANTPQASTDASLVALVEAQALKLAAIRDIGRMLSADIDLTDLLRLIMEHVTGIMEADRSTLFLVSEDRAWLLSKVIQGDDVSEIQLPMGSGIGGWVAENGQPLNLKDAYRDPRFDPEWDRRNHYKTTSMLCHPIVDRDGNIVGVLQVLNKRSGYFTVEDSALLEAVASQIAISIFNRRLVTTLAVKTVHLQDLTRKLEQKVNEIDLLYRIEQQIATSSDLDTLIEQLLLQVRAAAPVELVCIAVRTDEGGVVVHRLREAPAGSPPGTEPIVERSRRSPGVGISCVVAGTGSAVDVRATAAGLRVDGLGRDAPADARGRYLREEDLGLTLRNGLVVPLESADGTLGALSLWNRAPTEPTFTAEDRKLAQLLASQVARAVEVAAGRERARREERLVSIGQALASVVHDFKTPLTVASGYVQLLRDVEAAVERAQLARVVLQQLDQISIMSKDLLSFARGERELLVRRVLLNQFVDEVRRQLDGIFVGTGVQWRVETTYRGEAHFDEMKMRRVVQNLAKNARDALVDGGRFVLRIDRDDPWLVFSFADDGPGIPIDFRHRLFETFATTGKEGGTGLGLAMVKQFAESHGGLVEHADTPGGGATFIVRIPRDARMAVPQSVVVSGESAVDERSAKP